MGKWLMYLYLLLAAYCLVNVWLSVQAHAYQHTLLLFVMALINFGLFSIFRKEVRRQEVLFLQSPK